MSSKTPARVSKRTRGEPAEEVAPVAEVAAPETARKKTRRGTADEDATETAAPAAPETARKSKRGATAAVVAMEDIAEAAPVAAAAAPETARKSKRSAAAVEETVTAPATSKKSKKADTDAVVAAPATAGPSSGALAGLLALDSAALAAADSTDVASQLRALQQALLKSTTGNAADLLAPRMWPAFVERLEILQANTVRVDTALLNALSRTITEMVTLRDFTLLPTLHRLILLLLPCSATPAAQSWSATFRPTYDFFLGFLAGLVKHLVTLHSAQAAVPATLYSFVAAVFDAYALINTQQTTQRKVYDAALQERSLPMWAQLHQQLQALLVRPAAGCTTAMRTCSERIESVIGSVLFHSEHLALYADALGATNEEEAEEEAQAEIEDQKQAQEQADQEKKEREAEAMLDVGEEATAAPEGEAVKVEAAAATAAKGKKAAKVKGAAHKPHPANYTNKLFESVQSWLTKEDATLAFTSRSIRASLPLLFAGYIGASSAAFAALYPPALAATERHEREHVMGVGDARRKQAKERAKTQRELQFLQKMWQLNEQAHAQAAAATPAEAATTAAVFASPLTATSLPLLHDIFATNGALFRLIAQHDMYKIHQDANVHGANGTAKNDAFTGLKKILADQMDKVMTVARTIVLSNQTTAVTEKKPSKKATAATVESTVSPAALLSLSSTLSTNVLHLLQLNPEFVQKYLYVRGDDDEEEEASEPTANVWHLIWKVIQLSAVPTLATVEADNLMAVFSPASGSLTAARALSSALFRAFFKLRQWDVLFNSYVFAARSAGRLAAHLAVAPFATVNGPKFDLPALLRNIPPLKVPALWTWFLGQCEREFAAKATEARAQATGALVHFFVFFLDTMLVREEIALQLQALYTKSINAVLRGPFAALRGAADKQKSAATTGLASSSLFLLLHSLNEVKMQCDQHTTKTYETMLQPLAPYFEALDKEETEDEEAAASSVATQTTRLTDVLASLALSAARDATLLHALHLVSLQRLQQLARFQARNIVTNIFAVESTSKAYGSDSDDSDGEDKPKKAVVVKADKPAAATQSHLEEAQALTTFILEQQAACACYEATDAAAHAAFSWDGAAASLSGATVGTPAVALWQLVCAHLDVLSQFATEAQRAQLVARILDTTACRHCRASALEGKDADQALVLSSTSASALHTLGSLTTALLVQPWFFEVAALRGVMLDVLLARLVSSAHTAAHALKTKKDAASTSTNAAVRIPASFARTAALSTEFAALRPLAELVASGGAVTASSTGVVPAALWEAVWLLQLCAALPPQYLSTASTFHVLLLQVTFSLECSASVLATGLKSDEAEPLSLRALCASPLTAAALPSLHSHLFLACRRLNSACVSALAQTPSVLSAALAPLASWLCWTGFERPALRGRHVRLAQEATRRALKLAAPTLLLAPPATNKKDEKKEAVETVAVLGPVAERISRVLTGASSSTAVEVEWCVRLASALIGAFVPAWSQAGASETLPKTFKSLTRDGTLALATEWTSLVRDHVQPLVTKQLKAVAKHPETAVAADQLAGSTFELQATLHVAYFAGSNADAKSESKTKSATKLDQAESQLQEAVRVLTTSDATTSSAARTGALTFVHALCVAAPVLATSGCGVSFATLFQALFSVLASEQTARLASTSSTASTLNATVHAAFLSLISHASATECDETVDFLLAQLDPSFVAAQSAESDTPVASTESRVAASLQLAQAYLAHAHTPAQRRAVSHPRLALLFYRLAALSSVWHAAVESRTSGAPAGLALALSTLQLLASVLTRHQVYSLDDQAMALLAHALNQCASILKEEVTSSNQSSVARGTLAHPLYTVLYALLKYHAPSLVKIVPVYLSLLKTLLSWHWRQVQHATTSSPVALVSSENCARLLEELGSTRAGHGKLFNKYVVGLLLDWIHISKHRGPAFGQPQQEQHQKAINKGWFAVIGLCEEHDLSYLHNLLDASGRAIFRTLHASYKKNRFTGLV